MTGPSTAMTLPADVAVLPWAPAGLDDYDHLCYLASGFVTPEVLAEEQIGVGDEVFSPGCS